MAAENRPEEPEWQFVTSTNSLNGAEEEEYSDWFWVDNDHDNDHRGK